MVPVLGLVVDLTFYMNTGAVRVIPGLRPTWLRGLQQSWLAEIMPEGKILIETNACRNSAIKIDLYVKFTDRIYCKECICAAEGMDVQDVAVRRPAYRRGPHGGLVESMARLAPTGFTY
jgi:hypothetical protein